MITKNIKSRIKEYFMLYPTKKLRVRQIERELNLPLPSIIRYTKELEQEGIIKNEQITNIKAYSADRSSKYFILEKKLFNIKSIYDSGLIDYLIKNYDNPNIILFGSYSKGEDIEKSDIDIYIETTKKVERISENLEKELKRKIQIFRYKNINEIENKELANNIINGIKLNGFLEIFK